MSSGNTGRSSSDSTRPFTSDSGEPLAFRPNVPPRLSHQQAARRGSTASSIHSTPSGFLDVGMAKIDDEFYEPNQNSIFSLLQPPLLRTGLSIATNSSSASSSLINSSATSISSTFKAPTSRDIPPVTLSPTPHVEASEFQFYLQHMSTLYDKIHQFRLAEEAAQRLTSSSSPDNPSTTATTMLVTYTDDTPSALPSGRPHPPPSRKSSISSFELSKRRGLTTRRSQSQLQPQPNSYVASPSLPPLSTVPKVYLESDFHLENPRTFDVVSERSDVIPQDVSTNAQGSRREDGGSTGAVVPRKSLATNSILQEKISWYMDTVEMHLISAISTASTTFFSTLGSLRDLHHEAADSVHRIQKLRKEIVAVNEHVVKRGSALIHKRQQKINLRKLQDSIQQLQGILGGIRQCEDLMEKGDVQAALNHIEAVESLIVGEPDSVLPPNQQELLRNPAPPTSRVDLRGAMALHGISIDLSKLRLQIGRQYEANFHDVLLSDLREHARKVSSSEVLQRWSSASMRSRGLQRESSGLPSYLLATEALRSALVPLIEGLARSNYISAAVTAYRELVLREMKRVVRRPLPSSSDDDADSSKSSSSSNTARTGRSNRTAQEKSSTLTRNLQNLEPGDAEIMLVQVYVSVTETLRRLLTQEKILLDIASSFGGPGSPTGLKSPPFMRSPLQSPRFNNHRFGGEADTSNSPLSRPPQSKPVAPTGFEIQEEMHKSLDVTNLLGQAVDSMQDKVTSILRVRTSQSVHLPLPWFLRYFTLNLCFANECEAMSGRSGTTLKTLVNSHIAEFIRVHEGQWVQDLAQDMETDTWTSVDFGDAEKENLQRIIDSSTHDPPSWTQMSQVHIPPSEVKQSVSSQTPGPLSKEKGKDQDKDKERDRDKDKDKEKARPAEIDGESFLLPFSAVLCLRGIVQYLQLVVGIPSMAMEVGITLVTYLQMFNSRCTQLILGAGATRSAGLKNITTKHLALASQALVFVATLIPYIREFFRRHIANDATSPSGNLNGLLTEFSKIQRVLQEHQNNIYQKLVDIMTGRAMARARTIQSIEWDVEEDAVDKSPHGYSEILAKDTSMLYRVIHKHLPESSVNTIMEPVFDSYRHHIGEAYRLAQVTTPRGRKRMLADIDHISSRLHKIDGFREVGEFLRDIAESKQVTSVRPTTPSANHTVNSPTSTSTAADITSTTTTSAPSEMSTTLAPTVSSTSLLSTGSIDSEALPLPLSDATSEVSLSPSPAFESVGSGKEESPREKSAETDSGKADEKRGEKRDDGKQDGEKQNGGKQEERQNEAKGDDEIGNVERGVDERGNDEKDEGVQDESERQEEGDGEKGKRG